MEDLRKGFGLSANELALGTQFLLRIHGRRAWKEEEALLQRSTPICSISCSCDRDIHAKAISKTVSLNLRLEEMRPLREMNFFL